MMFDIRNTLYLYPRKDIFTREVSTSIIVLFVTFFSLGFIGYAVKLKACRWTPLVCGIEIFSRVSLLGIALYIVTRAETFTPGYMQFLAEVRENGLRLVFVGQNAESQIIEIDRTAINTTNPALRPGMIAAGVIIISLIFLARTACRLRTDRILKKRAAKGDEINA